MASEGAGLAVRFRVWHRMVKSNGSCIPVGCYMRCFIPLLPSAGSASNLDYPNIEYEPGFWALPGCFCPRAGERV